MNIIARVFIGLIFTVFCLLAWWVSGFDFNERGEEAVYCLFCSVFCAAAGLTCPLFDKE